MWYFTADLHLNHPNIIKYCKRPFMDPVESGLMSMVDSGSIPIHDVKISRESTESMTEYIISSINSCVGKSDTLVIVGDFCLLGSENRSEQIGELRSRINCDNVFLVLGNHDDREASSIHMKCCDQYTFNINGQYVFASHYPCRSWNKRNKGAWMLYGHVHGSMSSEDSLGVGTAELESIRKKFLSRFGNRDLVEEMLSDVVSCRTKLKTLDVGVDARDKSVRFGTPWSFEEIRQYMSKMS